MGYLTTYKASHKDYYNSNDLGNYQFTSLENIITQFQIAYVGENKLIPKLKKADVSFHAMRALQELSFDTFKSVKSQQIDLPPSLVMKLPHDYVNYTKVSWVDNCGIKYPLYPTSNTSNPFQIAQEENGDYFFPESYELLEIAGGFDNDLAAPWNTISKRGVYHDPLMLADTNRAHAGARVENGKLTFQNSTSSGHGPWNNGYLTTVYQAVDVSGIDYIDVIATGSSETLAQGTTVLRCGISTDPAITTASMFGEGDYVTGPGESTNLDPNIYNLTAASYSKSGVIDTSGGASYVEWNSSDVGDGNSVVGASNASTKSAVNIDVSALNSVYLVIVVFMDLNIQGVEPNHGVNDTLNDYYDAITAYHPDTLQDIHSNAIGDGNIKKFEDLGGNPDGLGYIHISGTAPTVASIDNISITSGFYPLSLNRTLVPPIGNGKESSTWNSYKGCGSDTCGDNSCSCDCYSASGERYGLDPEHSNVNGSYYIDQRLGRIHFSSNISGKTVILDYISDGIGTDAEMQVHKFAEEAMYKSIAHAVLSTSSYGQQLVPRLAKEKFAAIRKAKLRLSNIKLEELTQTLRGKSKQIKH
jgi:hypothetical protein